MASSGRQSRPERRVYAFGSCTPRTLSYLDNIPKVYRVYDAKPRRSAARSTGPTLKDYMREARQDASPVRRRDRSLDSSLHNKWAFGSSTPRELSYLKKIKPEYRVYDVKLEKMIDDDRRSHTTTFVPSHSGGVKRYIRRSSSMSLLSGGETKTRTPRAARLPTSQSTNDAAADSAKKRRPAPRVGTSKTRPASKTIRAVPQPVQPPPPEPAKSPRAPPVQQQQTPPPEPPKPKASPAAAIKKPPPPAESPTEDLDDEVASEPDFVQDRYADFARQMNDERTVAQETIDEKERIPSDDEERQQEHNDHHADHDDGQHHSDIANSDVDHQLSPPESPHANHNDEGKFDDENRQSRSSSIKSRGSSRNEPVHVHDFARTVQDVGVVETDAAFEAEQPFEHEEQEPAESPSFKEHDSMHLEHPSRDRMSPLEAAGEVEPEWERRMQAHMLPHEDHSAVDEDDGSAAEPSAFAQHHSELKENTGHEEHEGSISYSPDHHAQAADDGSDQLADSFDQRAHQLESPIDQHDDHHGHESPDHQARFSDSPEHEIRMAQSPDNEDSHPERFAKSPDHHDDSSPPPPASDYHHGDEPDAHRFDADSPVQDRLTDESNFTAVQYQPEPHADRKDSSSSSSSSDNSRKSSSSAQKTTGARTALDGEHHPVGNGATRHTDMNDANGNDSDTF